MIRILRRILLVFVSVIVLTIATPPTASGGVAIDSVLLESEAVAGEDMDSFSETEFGFYNAIASFSVGIGEDYLASGVVSADFYQSPLGPTLGVQLDALATAFTRPGSSYSASVSASAAISFSTNIDSTLFIPEPTVGVILTRVSDSLPVDLIDGAFLSAGSYQLFAEIYASPNPDGESTDSATGLITLRLIPEPKAGVMLVLFGMIFFSQRPPAGCDC
ncbi:hypothetical protein [Bythopirellula goksoeyrii]|uniref:Uncharacterized protein n=1 Tax=Bythopirellula goksoeyrii TaxID=1400387 RepID=A0A5B9QL10_9BACT|nr:hypothetical protein [Bythopirellula goksoeyrii]QEG37736.1 hypothetical protein Pr1d_50830 [Bythopirellula goksoeyrii]